jgi:hypothetical protein
MIKPITDEEKLNFTLKTQADKATNEILWQLLDEKYNGFVDLWPQIYKKKNQIILEIKYKKIKSSTDPKTNTNSIRYHVLAEKGVKLINA